MRKRIMIPLLCVILICAVAVSVWLAAFLRINRLYPQSTREVVSIGEEMSFGDFRIKGLSAEFLNFEEYKNKYGNLSNIEDIIEDNNGDASDVIFAIVKTEIKNVGTQDQGIILYNTTISSHTYSNGIDGAMFAALNGTDEKLGPTIKAGMSEEIIFTYTLYRSVLYAEDGGMPDMELVFNLYPEHRAISLN